MTQSIGPPSLAQGTRIAVGFSTSISRFIPACGELSKPSWAIVQLDGSSPLARGTRMNVKKLLSTRRFIPAYAGNSYQSIQHQQKARFIPAYAGNSGLRPAFRKSPTVHPRLRGELITENSVVIGSAGSSPLTRGTLIIQFGFELVIRFIPAYAGNSMVNSHLAQSPTVHPRLRGELLVGSAKGLYDSGSSPLTRGTHLKTV